MAPPTILAHKSAFLSAQTLQLSQNLAPSGAWRNHVHEDAENQATVTEKAVDDALYRLNHALQQHARRVYAPQATRHIAEQIDQLFLDINKDVDDDPADGDDEEGNNVQKGDELRQGADFTSDSAIAALPPTWDQIDAHETQSRPAEAAYYDEVQTRLTELSARRAETRARVERLRAMQNLLQPFRGSDAGADNDIDNGDGNPNKKLQENLVTRNGAVEKELERMRFLLVRVAGRVGQLPAQNREEDEDMIGDLDKAERGKVQSLLDSF
ncbi:kinetochore protein [Apiospora sp. TS-2023a]